MPKTTITRNEYLQLVGLLTLAKRHCAALTDIAQACVAITDERDDDGDLMDNGHTFDAVWSEGDADDLLRKLELTVAEE